MIELLWRNRKLVATRITNIRKALMFRSTGTACNNYGFAWLYIVPSIPYPCGSLRWFLSLVLPYIGIEVGVVFVLSNKIVELVFILMTNHFICCCSSHVISWRSWTVSLAVCWPLPVMAHTGELPVYWASVTNSFSTHAAPMVLWRRSPGRRRDSCLCRKSGYTTWRLIWMRTEEPIVLIPIHRASISRFLAAWDIVTYHWQCPNVNRD